MKKITLYLGVIAALVFGQTSANLLRADNIDVNKARQLAANYMAVQTGQKNLSSNDLKLVYEIPNVEQGVAALYFFNTSNGGFVVMSASDCMDPVLAYSTEGVLDPNNLPPAMLWWMNGYANTICYAQNNNLTPDAEVKAMWNELERKDIRPDEPKAIYKTMTSVWNQDYPYNIYSPKVNGERCPTGCVATAMGQIVHYWKYPVKPKGMVNYQYTCGSTNTSHTLGVNFDTVKYDYSLMPDTAFRGYSNQTWWNDAQIREVSKLNYHLGIANRMSYDLEGSGAQSGRYTKNAFVNYYKYRSNTIKELDRSNAFWANNTTTPNAKDTLWVDTLANEIKNKRPVFYTGYDISSSGVHAGHAFVLERFNTTTFKGWFNWGWGGSGDCWCNIVKSALNTAGYNFSNNHNAIIGIQPPKDSINTGNVGITTVSQEIEILPAYPNPANTWINIPYNLGNNTSALLQIFAIDGRLMEQRTIYSSSNKAAVNVESYPHGIYVCRIGGISRKFIVE